MDKNTTNFKFIVEHYPYNKILTIKHTISKQTLKIDTKKFSLSEETTEDLNILSHAFKLSYKVDAIYGKIKLTNHSYLIVIDKSAYVGKILGSSIFKVLSSTFINISKDSEQKEHKSQQSEEIDKNDKSDHLLIKMLKETLNSGYVYFSDNYFLTNTLQSQLGNEINLNSADQAYFLNFPFAEKFVVLKGKSANFINSFIFGFVVQKDFFLQNGQLATFTLISRKNTKRLGTRFYSRGIDANGFVSNFAESETILEISENDVSKRFFSHVQIRGSIPLYWSQLPSLKYTPSIQLEKNESSNEASMKLHFKRVVKRYGSVQCINMIDKKGSQKLIGSAFDRVFTSIKNSEEELSSRIHLEWFDFHHECRNMNFSSIKKLVNFIKGNISDFGYFEANVIYSENNMKCQIKRQQNGVIRTNCIDCLDRTSVFQTVYSRLIHHEIFAKLNLGNGVYDCLSPLPEFIEMTFRGFWTDNANALSLLYSGTNALKTDCTRFGKRTYRGMLEDGKNSVVRYIINNFYDHHTQNSLDLLTESIKPERLVHYEKLPVNKFLLKFLVIVLMPIIVDILFRFLGIRFNGKLFYLLFALSSATAYFYITGNMIRPERCVFEGKCFEKFLINSNLWISNIRF